MVTLNKPVAGDTDWTTEINNNWTSIEGILNGSLQHIETKVISGANVGSVTFSGLAGNSDGTYYLVGRVVYDTGGEGIMGVQPNSDGTTGNYRGSYHFSGGSHGYGNQPYMIITWALNNNTFQFWGVLFAKSGYKRCYTGLVFEDDGTTYYNVQGGGVWSNTADEITALKILASGGTKIKAGSEFRLYKVPTV